MSDEWTFWQDQLTGKEPESTPGNPHNGYFLAKEYITIPGGAKRVLTEIPVAIWFEADQWQALITRPTRDIAIFGVDSTDDLFARCCREAIQFDDYCTRLKQIREWRNGNDDWRNAA